MFIHIPFKKCLYCTKIISEYLDYCNEECFIKQLEQDKIIFNAMKNYKNYNKWDVRFLELAKHISSWSKDPSTKVGAVIVDEDNRIISTGYNGFPKGVSDKKEDYLNRELKLQKIVHAEMNALIFAKKDLKNCTLFTYPFAPCSRCTGPIIQTGIKRCVAPFPSADILSRWKKDLDISAGMFEEAGVELVLIDMAL